ncbi:MAG: murein transglycosylase [Alphaproteobacteria bacterium]|nr:murein transglycosylase [Alphaproteobacteria bacterium]
MGVRARRHVEKSQLEDHRNVRPRFRQALRHTASAGLILLLAGCALFKPEDKFGAREASFSDLPGWQEENHAEALGVFLVSCETQAKKPEVRAKTSGIAITQGVWRSLCAEAVSAQGNPQAARAFFERRFIPFRINNNGREEGLFTGYYEPLLYGSPHRHGDFRYPVYALPPDIREGTPYLSRDEIERGALSGRGLELMWVDDPVMLFFLQIQGSGRVRFMDGREMRVGYAGKNNHPYVALGKIMREEKLLPEDGIHFFSIRQWLYMNREQAFPMMARNPSYVFFRLVEGAGPIGSVGVPLTPYRSLAVDSRYIPYGLPLFLETELAGEPQRPPMPFSRLMVAQDTGGAIRGPVRGDIFFGAGDTAEYYAGYMKSKGRYNLLVPREVAAQLRTDG